MTSIELDVHETLPWENDKHHGLFFIEYGQLRMQHSSDQTATMSFPGSSAVGGILNSGAFNSASNTSIGHMNARSGTIGRQSALQKITKTQHEHMMQSFRLARIGQGWVIGCIESCSGMRRPGVYIARKCVSSGVATSLTRPFVQLIDRTISHRVICLPRFSLFLKFQNADYTICIMKI